LNGTPRNTSALRWYSWHESLPSPTQNWNKAWHGVSDICSSSPTFQALTTMRRESGLRRIRSMVRLIWSIGRPSGPGQARHCLP
jgi:hypothetical protein